MTRARVPDFPALRGFFGGYLHEDFVAEYGTPEGALRAFDADASEAERRKLRAEARKLLSQLEPEDLDELRARFAALGARWAVRSRAAGLKLLARMSAPDSTAPPTRRRRYRTPS